MIVISTRYFYIFKVKVINPVKYRRVYEEALKKMDKLENEFLPQVTVDIPGAAMAPHSNRNEIHFGNIRVFEPVKKTFTVANTGQVRKLQSYSFLFSGMIIQVLLNL